MKLRRTHAGGRVLSRRPRGAVLAVSLLLLLILTLIGVSAMRGVTMEERMAGNTTDFNVALQGAEAGLRDAEDLLEQPVLPYFLDRDGLYQPAAADQPPRWRTVDWTSRTATREYAGFEDAPGSLSRVQVRWFVEELPRVPGVGDSLSVDTPVEDSAFFRVTARGVGIGAAAQAVLQTTYKR